ncbi:MAG: iron-containing alcohol dehydrogenase [Bacteriovoracaceae bacterium]|nr:iron-containing alcohol dehydrogenase [Bacteriovoracaceae bacterium]
MSWTERHTYSFPTTIRFGAGVLDELPEFLISKGFKSPLLVSDRAICELSFYNRLLDQLNKKDLKSSVFKNIDKNPTKQNVIDGKEAFLENNSDCIIGIGGGASMDVARAIALWAHHDRDLFDFDDAHGGEKYVTEQIPFLICIPTTSGTGSEVGRSCVISENDTHEKRILYSPKLMASMVFADPELTLQLPAMITATTGMDALTHNIEAYVAKGLHPICDGIAIKGVKLIIESLEDAVQAPTLENRAKMMMASLMGAIAFQKGLGVVHSLSHALSTKFDTHHGLANALMLTHGIDFNSSVSQKRFDDLATFTGIENLSVWIDELRQCIGLPRNLCDIGVNETHTEALAEIAFNDPCHVKNPRQCTQNDLEDIFKKALRC